MEKKRWAFLLHLFFHLVRIQSGSNSSFSSKSNPSDQQEQDKIVEFLPGQDFNVNFAHYSGYIKVNEEAGRTLFYWFIEAVEDPSSKPLLLWTQGGLGCSSIGFGEAEEIGPFHINADGKTLYQNHYSWNEVANIIFVDSPVGTGFSYSNNPSDLETNGDKRTAEDSLEFLLKWFDRFPQYKGRDFYLVGESYAGHYIPQLAQAIVRYHKTTEERSINLKGYMLGNPLIDDFYDHLGGFEFLWTTGLISDQTYKLLNLYCDHVSYVHSSDECSKISDVASSELGNIDVYSIFTPSCTSNVSYSNSRSKGLFKVEHISEKYDPCARKHSIMYFNLPEVQKALHINPEVAPSKWEICSEVGLKTWKDTSPVLDIYRELINLGLRIWVFSGDTDTAIPITSTQYSINALKLPVASPWRAWYNEGQVGGWTEEYDGLTFVSIRGAGHMVPLTKPKQALALIKSFLSGSSMPSLSEFRHS